MHAAVPWHSFWVTILRFAHKTHINSNHDLLFMFGLGFCGGEKETAKEEEANKREALKGDTTFSKANGEKKKKTKYHTVILRR